MDQSSVEHRLRHYVVPSRGFGEGVIKVWESWRQKNSTDRPKVQDRQQRSRGELEWIQQDEAIHNIVLDPLDNTAVVLEQ